MKLDILAFAAHPDDVEISCSGTLLKHIAMGAKVGLVDFTRGELGTRGSAEIRAAEAEAAAKILGASARVNLDLPDGFFRNDTESLLKIARTIRTFQPEIVIANSLEDRHPDHARAADMMREACFLAGLHRIETTDDAGNVQSRWRPKALYHYIQDYQLHPDIVVDITPYFEQKMESIKAYRSQFYDPNSNEPDSPISNKDFLDFLEAKARIFGRYIGVTYGEGFNVRRPVGVANLLKLL